MRDRRGSQAAGFSSQTPTRAAVTTGLFYTKTLAIRSNFQPSHNNKPLQNEILLVARAFPFLIALQYCERRLLRASSEPVLSRLAEIEKATHPAVRSGI